MLTQGFAVSLTANVLLRQAHSQVESLFDAPFRSTATGQPLGARIYGRATRGGRLGRRTVVMPALGEAECMPAAGAGRRCSLRSSTRSGSAISRCLPS